MSIFSSIHQNNHPMPVALLHKRPFHRIGRDPHVDWVILTIITAVTTLVLVFFAVNLSLKSRKELNEAADSSTSKTFKAADTRSLDKVLADFENRAGLRSQLESGYVGPSDPSI